MRSGGFCHLALRWRVAIRSLRAPVITRMLGHGLPH
jgi:hypothetical protein